jgi:hypothetical protein
MPDKKMILSPDATAGDFMGVAMANAMHELANRLEAQQERGLEITSAFTIIALSEEEARELTTLLQEAKIPKRLYDLRHLMKPSNIVTIKRGGQG